MTPFYLYFKSLSHAIICYIIELSVIRCIGLVNVTLSRFKTFELASPLSVTV